MQFSTSLNFQNCVKISDPPTLYIYTQIFMLLAEMLSTESDAHILDEIIDKILTHKANKSNPTVEPMVGKNSNKRMPQKQTELPISAENHVAPNDVTPQYLNDSEHSNDVPVQMPSSNGKPQQYVCKTCGQNYKSITRFTEHLRRHTGEKPYGMLTF